VHTFNAEEIRALVPDRPASSSACIFAPPDEPDQK
jgi:hypothetical protein